MNNLSLNELIDFSLGFNSETDQEVCFENVSIEESKELAYNEIQRRSKIYYEENQIAQIVEKLNFLKTQIHSIDSSICIVYDYYDDSYQIMQKIIEYSTDFYAPNFKKIKTEIYQLFSVLNNLWVNDPEYLRYNSKFWNTKYPQPYINSSEFELDLLFTKDFCFKINAITLFSKELIPNTIKEFKNANVTIYPLFLSNNLNANQIFEFLLYYQIMKWKYAKIIILLFYRDDKKNAFIFQENILNRIFEYNDKNVFYFENIIFKNIDITNNYQEQCKELLDLINNNSILNN